MSKRDHPAILFFIQGKASAKEKERGKSAGRRVGGLCFGGIALLWNGIIPQW